MSGESRRCDCCRRVEETSPVHTPFEKPIIHLCDDCLGEERCDRLQMYFGTILACENCGEYAVHHKLGEQYARLYDTDESYCDDCADEMLGHCEECGAWHFKEYVVEVEDIPLCEECREQSEDEGSSA